MIMPVWQVVLQLSKLAACIRRYDSIPSSWIPWLVLRERCWASGWVSKNRCMGLRSWCGDLRGPVPLYVPRHVISDWFELVDKAGEAVVLRRENEIKKGSGVNTYSIAPSGSTWDINVVACLPNKVAIQFCFRSRQSLTKGTGTGCRRSGRR